MNVLLKIKEKLSQKCSSHIKCFTEIEDFPCKNDKTFESFFCIHFDALKELVKHKFESTPKSADAFMIFQDSLLFLEFKTPWKKSFKEAFKEKFSGIENGNIRKIIKESLEKNFKLREKVDNSLQILSVILEQEVEKIPSITKFYFIFSFTVDFLEDIEKAVPLLKLRKISLSHRHKVLVKIRNTVIEVANMYVLKEVTKELKLQDCEALSCEDFRDFWILNSKNNEIFIYPNKK